MTSYVEPNNLGDLVKYEADNYYSRDVVTLESGQNLKIGTVLGQITASGKMTALAPGAETGQAAAVGILLQDTDASAADQETIMLARHSTVVDSNVIWPAGIQAAAKNAAITQLKTLGILIRKGV
jgi:hypothetical protein